MSVVSLHRALPEDELLTRISEALVAAGILTSASSAFAAAISSLVKGSVDMLGDAAGQVPQLLGYPLSETVQSEDFKPVRGGAADTYGRCAESSNCTSSATACQQCSCACRCLLLLRHKHLGISRALSR
jgi:hypothetical protein